MDNMINGNNMFEARVKKTKAWSASPAPTPQAPKKNPLDIANFFNDKDAAAQVKINASFDKATDFQNMNAPRVVNTNVDSNNDGVIDANIEEYLDEHGNAILSLIDANNDGVVDDMVKKNYQYNAQGQVTQIAVDYGNDKIIDEILNFEYDSYGNVNVTKQQLTNTQNTITSLSPSQVSSSQTAFTQYNTAINGLYSELMAVLNNPNATDADKAAAYQKYESGKAEADAALKAALGQAGLISETNSVEDTAAVESGKETNEKEDVASTDETSSSSETAGTDAEKLMEAIKTILALLGSGDIDTSKLLEIINQVLGGTSGDDNKVDGDDNKVDGGDNKVDGDDNKVDGDDNKVDGDDNKVDGDDNKVDGDDNKVDGGDNKVDGDSDDLDVPDEDSTKVPDGKIDPSKTTTTGAVTDKNGQVVTEYDSNGNVVRKTTTKVANGICTQTIYNADTKKTITCEYKGSKVDFNKITKKTVTDANGKKTVSTYKHKDGKTIESYTDNGKNIEKTYNSKGTLTQKVIKETDSKTKQTKISTITYASDGKTKKKQVIEEKGKTTTISYDEKGNKKSKKVVHAGANGTKTYTYSYNSKGEAVKESLKEGNTTTFYDAKGKVTHKEVKSGNTTTTYNSSGVKTQSITIDGSKTTTSYYDKKGEKINKKIIVNGNTQTTKFYNDNEKISEEVILNTKTGEKTTKTYNKNGVLSKEVVEEKGKKTTITYNTSTQTKEKKVVKEGSKTTTTMYNAKGKTSQKKVEDGGKTKYYGNYTFDDKGNKKTCYVDNNGDGKYDQKITYNADGSVKSTKDLTAAQKKEAKAKFTKW